MQQSQESEQANEINVGVPFEQNLHDEYAELDALAQQANTTQTQSETGEQIEQTEPQEMSEEDTAAAAGFFVNTGAGFVESMFSVPVTIDHDTKEVIAQKTVPVIAKYAKGATLPPWLIRYREEIELLGVLAMAGLSIYKQINMHKKLAAKEQKAAKSNMQFDQNGEVTISAS
ncbi:hypothetical protein [Idiomarina abyssalis]|uniref:hypothetical protein n=1 Tax=Idiomarina abyssalis TaxID=86102 RepID=UPI003A939437